eukprot:6323098-Pyramimonas_sp.AAC.1
MYIKDSAAQGTGGRRSGMRGIGWCLGVVCGAPAPSCLVMPCASTCHVHLLWLASLLSASAFASGAGGAGGRYRTHRGP